MSACSNCGFEVGDGQNFCPECGRPLSEAAQEQMDAEQAAPGESTGEFSSEVASSEHVNGVAMKPHPLEGSMASSGVGQPGVGQYVKPLDPVPVVHESSFNTTTSDAYGVPSSSANQAAGTSYADYGNNADMNASVNTSAPVAPGVAGANNTAGTVNQPATYAQAVPNTANQAGVNYPSQPTAAPVMTNYANAEISTAGYIGYLILFWIPFIGFIIAIAVAFGAQNKNLKNFATAKAILGLIGVIGWIMLISMGMFF